MREIALLLVLANLGFFAWDRWVAPGESARVAAASARADVPRLVLAGEAAVAPRSEEAAGARAEDGGGVDSVAPGPSESGFGQDQAGAAIEVEDAAAPAGTEAGSPEDAADVVGAEGVPPGATAGVITQDVPADARPANGAAIAPPATVSRVALAATTPAPQCVSLGPFLDLAETAEAAARLRERGHAPSQRLADSPLWVGYWVYLAPFATRDQAVAAAEKLRAGGIEDLYVEPSGVDQNAVSLGLYSDRARAEALAATIRGLGHTPQISDKYRTASVYWVDVVLPPRVTLNAANYAVRSGRAVRAEEHECPQGTPMPGVVADARDEE